MNNNTNSKSLLPINNLIDDVIDKMWNDTQPKFNTTTNTSVIITASPNSTTTQLGSYIGDKIIGNSTTTGAYYHDSIYYPTCPTYPIWIDYGYDKYYSSYPVTNHYIDEEGTNVFEVAVPGWIEDDIDVKIEDNILYIKGEKSDNDDKKKRGYLCHKISKSNFNVSYKLSEKLDVSKVRADIKRGVLTITIPLKEENKPYTIQVKINK